MDSPVSHRSIELNIDPGLNAANDAAHFDAIIRDTERSCVTTYDSSCRKRFEKPSIGLYRSLSYQDDRPGCLQSKTYYLVGGPWPCPSCLPPIHLLL